MANVAAGFFESGDGVGLFFGGAFDDYVNTGLLQIRRNADLGNGHADFEAWIAQLSGEHDINLVMNFLGDAFVAVSNECHVVTLRLIMRVVCCSLSCKAFETKFLEQFNLMIDQMAAKKSFGIFQDALQSMFDEAGLIGQCYDSDGEALPEILMLEFGD